MDFGYQLSAISGQLFMKYENCILLRFYDHRHPVVDFGQQGVGIGGKVSRGRILLLI
jgi:hypothetical protein